MCPQVKVIEFGGYERSMHNPDGPEWEEEKHVRLSSDVETFSLGISDLADFDILNDLTFTNLTSFTMFSMDDLGENHDSPQECYLSTLDPITSFLTRSSCMLTSLNWSNMPTTIAAFLSLLNILPSLMSLSISEEKRQSGRRLITDKFFKKFQIERASLSTECKIFLPNLDTLFLVAKRTLDFSDSFIDAITSRWFPNEETLAKCLKSVTIKTPTRHFEDYEECDIVPRLKELAEVGMKIMVEDKSGVILC